MLIKDQLERKDHFTYIEEILADFYLEKGSAIEDMSARSIAKQINTAPSTISRFAQKLGFEGFPEFRKAYLKEITYLENNFEEIDANYPFTRSDKNTVIATKIGSLYHDVIDDNLSLMDHDTLQKAINMIDRAETIYIVCGGVQNDVAKTFKNKMLKIGKNVVIDNHQDNLFYRAAYCNSTDCFIIISYSGELDTTLKIARKVVERGIPSIAITSIGGNSLSNLCDVTLPVSSKETLIDNLGNFSMNISVLFILDILYVSYFNQNYERHLQNKQDVSREFENRRSSNISLLRNSVSKK